jgi:maltose alpha-D-glucosyltransferase/alpha-amylase
VPIGAFGQWSTFLRNHDEGDFSRLSQAQRDEVFAAFGPKPEMQLYGRGIRRRLAPMLDGDERRVRLANALFLTLPGTCVIRYGEEIGMGEDLSLPERNAIRTPMQWTDDLNGGFSRADPKQLILPLVSKGPFAFDKVNVDRQRRDPNSLLLWFSHALHTLREHREVGLGSCTVVDGAPSSVLMHVMASPSGATLFIHNLSDSEATVRPGRLPDQDGRPIEVLSDAPYPNVPDDLGELTVNGYGYRWIRIRHSASW